MTDIQEANARCHLWSKAIVNGERMIKRLRSGQLGGSAAGVNEIITRKEKRVALFRAKLEIWQQCLDSLSAADPA